MDLKREQAYTSLIANLEKMNHREQIAWLSLILETEFTEEEAKKIKILFVDSPDASKIANYPIKRPVIECTDAKTVILLAEKTGLTNPEKVGDFVLSGGRLSKKGPDNTGLIVTTNNPETTKHEIRHSIEPRQRFGLERALSEVFAYAEECIKTREWQKLEKFVTDEMYFDTYKTGTNDIDPQIREQFLTDEKARFKKEVHQIVEQLRKRIEEIGEIPALRELLTIGSIIEYTDEEFRKKREEMTKINVR